MPASSTGKSGNTGICYLVGDATRPAVNGNKIITHVCNNIGKWGRGFVLAVSRRWREPEREFKKKRRPSIGTVQMVQVEDDTWVANMFAQEGIRGSRSTPPIRYFGVDACLEKVGEKAVELNASIHMPRIGCGLAGGKWKKIEPIIQNQLISRGLAVYVYDLNR